MRILVHAPAPWMKTGYGRQCGIFARQFAEAGHEVTISSFGGLQGRSITWEGIQVLGGSREAHGNDFLGVRAAAWLSEGPGLLLIIGDTWCFNPRTIAGGPVAMWTPVDCEPMSVLDQGVIAQSGAIPIAVSKFGKRMMDNAGFKRAEYVPHGIDTEVFRPGDRAEARKLLEFPHDGFIIGMNGANSDSGPSRKAFPQVLQAFKAFSETHPEAYLALHTRMDGPDGAIHFHELTERLGITEKCFYSNQVEYWQGTFSDEYLAAFYSACDVLAQPSFGEGFGLPALEAQACGVPVIVSRHSAMPEVCGSGWLVEGDPWWQNDHLAFWHYPYPGDIHRAMNEAYDVASSPKRFATYSTAARVHALNYKAETVMRKYWGPVLKRLEESVVPRPAEKEVPDACLGPDRSDRGGRGPGSDRSDREAPSVNEEVTSNA